MVHHQPVRAGADRPFRSGAAISWPRLGAIAIAMGNAAWVPSALAQCVAPDPALPNVVTCSGANTTPQAVVSTAPEVTTAPGFSVVSTGTALTITATSGGASYIDPYASPLTSGITGLDVNVTGTGSLNIETNGAIRGNQNGVHTNNFGSGATNVVTRGDVAAPGGSGIVLVNGADVPEVNLRAEGDVHSTRYGILVVQFAGPASNMGAYNVTALGDVIAVVNNGIEVSASGSAITVSANNVSGGRYGMLIGNAGFGASTVTTTGFVDGLVRSGIYIENFSTATDLTLHAATVSGTLYGIETRQNGTGRTDITADRIASDRFGFIGMFALIGANGGDATVRVGEVSAHQAGILVANQGRGAASVTTTGAIMTTGVSAAIQVHNLGATSTDLTITTSDVVVGGSNGIRAWNRGSGTIRIEAGAAVTARTGAGIDAIADAGAGDIFVTAADTSGQFGIRATNWGQGAATIVSAGLAMGTGDGIRAVAEPDPDTPGRSATAGSIAITVNDATGGNNGIAVDNRGTGDTTIEVKGTVQGDIAAINASGTPDRALAIVNDGTLRNLSGSSASQAIYAAGGPVFLVNNGTLFGTLNLAGAGGGDAVVNNGVFSSAGGSSDFGAGDDRLTNSGNGRILAGLRPTPEVTSFANLEMLANAGQISMQDGAPGDMMTTSGAIEFAAGSQLAIDLGAGETDQLTAGGAIIIRPGATLTINEAAPVRPGERYVFLTAGGGITGTFLFAQSLQTAFAGKRVGYTASTAYFELAQLRALAAAGATRNQRSVAAGIDSLSATNTLRSAAILLPTDGAARAAFDNLSGEIHPSARTAMVEDVGLVRTAVFSPLEAPRQGGIWGQAIGNWGAADADANAARMRRESVGMLLGIDADLADGLMAGIAGGYLDDDLRIPDRASTGSIRSWHVMAYLGWRAGQVTVGAGGGYAHMDIATRRQAGFSGFAGGRLRADYGGSLWHGFASIGYRAPLGEGYVEPFAGIEAQYVRTDAFAERGDPAAALIVSRGSDEAIVATGGLRFRTSATGKFAVGGELGLAHAFGRLAPTGRHAFAGSDRFEVIGAPRSRAAAHANIGIAYRVTDDMDIGFAYDGTLGSAGQSNAVKGRMRIAF